MPEPSKKLNFPRCLIILAICILLSGVMASCRSKTSSLSSVMPAARVASGWKIAEKVKVYERQDLRSLVKDNLDVYLAYDVVQAVVQSYKNKIGSSLSIELWQMADVEDAYGLFTAQVSGSPYQIGNDGDLIAGQRLAFWQDRYFVQIKTDRKINEDDLLKFGRAVAGDLPSGGDRPALVRRLPTQGLGLNGVLYFHLEPPVRKEIRLAENSSLNLSSETRGVVARYSRGDPSGDINCRLLLIQYPSGAEAADNLKPLLAGAPLDELVVTRVSGNMLSAVFGEVSQDHANQLLDEVLLP